ncbi:MAG: hypothetical protein ACI8ZF_000001 [Candidatus Midichloriaceae bacterium]|jgi:hypothetical protein
MGMDKHYNIKNHKEELFHDSACAAYYAEMDELESVDTNYDETSLTAKYTTKAAAVY